MPLREGLSLSARDRHQLATAFPPLPATLRDELDAVERDAALTQRLDAIQAERAAAVIREENDAGAVVTAQLAELVGAEAAAAAALARRPVAVPRSVPVVAATATPQPAPQRASTRQGGGTLTRQLAPLPASFAASTTATMAVAPPPPPQLVDTHQSLKEMLALSHSSGGGVIAGRTPQPPPFSPRVGTATGGTPRVTMSRQLIVRPPTTTSAAAGAVGETAAKPMTASRAASRGGGGGAGAVAVGFAASGFTSILRWAAVSVDEAMHAALHAGGGGDATSSPSPSFAAQITKLAPKGAKLLTSSAMFVLDELLSNQQQQPALRDLWLERLRPVLLAAVYERSGGGGEKETTTTTAAGGDDDDFRFGAAVFAVRRTWREAAESLRDANAALESGVDALRTSVAKQHKVFDLAANNRRRYVLGTTFRAWRGFVRTHRRADEALDKVLCRGASRARVALYFLRWRRLCAFLRWRATRDKSHDKAAQVSQHLHDRERRIRRLEEELEECERLRALDVARETDARLHAEELHGVATRELLASHEAKDAIIVSLDKTAKRWERLAKMFRPLLLGAQRAPVPRGLLTLGMRLRRAEDELVLKGPAAAAAGGKERIAAARAQLESFLVAWVNDELSRVVVGGSNSSSGRERRVSISNATSDLRDGEVYLLLAKALAEQPAVDCDIFQTLTSVMYAHTAQGLIPPLLSQCAARHKFFTPELLLSDGGGGTAKPHPMAGLWVLSSLFVAHALRTASAPHFQSAPALRCRQERLVALLPDVAAMLTSAERPLTAREHDAATQLLAAAATATSPPPPIAGFAAAPSHRRRLSNGEASSIARANTLPASAAAAAAITPRRSPSVSHLSGVQRVESVTFGRNRRASDGGDSGGNSSLSVSAAAGAPPPAEAAEDDGDDCDSVLDAFFGSPAAADDGATPPQRPAKGRRRRRSSLVLSPAATSALQPPTQQQQQPKRRVSEPFAFGGGGGSFASDKQPSSDDDDENDDDDYAAAFTDQRNADATAAAVAAMFPRCSAVHSTPEQTPATTPRDASLSVASGDAQRRVEPQIPRALPRLDRRVAQLTLPQLFLALSDAERLERQWVGLARLVVSLVARLRILDLPSDAAAVAIAAAAPPHATTAGGSARDLSAAGRARSTLGSRKQSNVSAGSPLLQAQTAWHPSATELLRQQPSLALTASAAGSASGGFAPARRAARATTFGGGGGDAGDNGDSLLGGSATDATPATDRHVRRVMSVRFETAE